MHHRFERWRVTARAMLAALVCLTALAVGGGIATADKPPVDDPLVTAQDTRPRDCSWRFRDPNPRERRIDKAAGTYLHEMSNPPTCAPHGPVLGTLKYNSTFVVYYADPYATDWCYGYSWQVAKTGYVLCSSLGYK